MKNKWARLLSAVGLGILLGLGASLPTTPMLPYKNPEVVSAKNLPDGSVVLTVSLEKEFNECTFAALRVSGIIEGTHSKELKWEDIEGDRGDRLAGRHTLNLRIYLVDGVEFIQAVTRHYCGDNKVDLILFEKNLSTPAGEEYAP